MKRLLPLLLTLIFSISASAATYTVTRSDDRDETCVAGDCSLREAVKAANASSEDDRIFFSFDVPVITLTNEIRIGNIMTGTGGALSIVGTGADNLMINGGAGTNRIFNIFYSPTTIANVTLTSGDGIGSGDTKSGSGGAIYAISSTLNLDRVVVTGNSTPSNFSGGAGGGGIYLDLGNTVITNSTFSNNTSDYGGGLFVNKGSLNVSNSTVSGNTARVFGGGIYDGNFSGGAMTILRSDTVTNNTAQSIAGGIYKLSGTINFGNTILAGNTSQSGTQPEIRVENATVTSSGNNLVGNVPFNSSNTSSPIAYQSTDILDTDPKLGVLQYNGGTTPTHALLTGSPAINAGNNALAASSDQRGFPRIVGGTIDIGAYESDFVPVTPTPTITPTPSPSPTPTVTPSPSPSPSPTPGCSYLLSPMAQTFSASGGTASIIAVTQPNCSDSVTTGDSFVTIDRKIVGTDAGQEIISVVYTVAANSGEARAGTILFGGTQAFTIYQDSGQPSNCTYNFSETSRAVGSSGGTFSFSVTTQPGCSEVVKSNNAFVMINTITISETSTESLITVTYSVAANTADARTGTISVGDQIYTINQSARAKSRKRVRFL